MRTVILSKKEKKRYFVGDIEFHQLKNSPSQSTQDLRFCLFTYNDKVYANNAILIDVDNIALNRLSTLMNKCEEVFGKYKMYHLFTGNGHHIYIPLNKTFSEEQRKHYKTSYLNKVKKLETLIKTEVDKGCFNGPRYGRVPKSLNLRWGVLPYYLGENDYPVCDSVGEVLDYSKVIPTVSAKKPKENKETYDNPIYKFCGFIRHCHTNAKTLSHELWNKAMCGLSKANAKDLAHEISREYPDYDPVEVDKYFVTGKDYYVLCSTVSSMLGDLDNNPCHGCPHHLKGNSFSNITGRLPTPSAKDGFYYQKKVKEGDNEYYMPDLTKPHLNDVFNVYINLNDGKLAVKGDSVYKYTGPIWEEVIRGVRSGKIKHLNIQERKDIYNIPTYKIQDDTAQFTLWKKFALTDEIPEIPHDDWNSEEIIGFDNGVLELNTGKFKEHDPEFYLTRLMDFSYDPTATCPEWKKVLANSIQNLDDLRLFQVFAGLALSNIPTRLYKQYLWMYGLPDTGKSLFVHVLATIVGKHGVINFPPAQDFSKTDGKFNRALEHGTLYVIDDFKFVRNSSVEKRSWEAVSNVLVGGSSVVVKKLYKDEAEVTPKGTLFVTSNNPPYASHLGSGGMARLRIIRTINPYPKSALQSQDLAKKLEDESAGIFNWAMEGLKYFQKYGMPPYSDEEQCERDEMEEKHEGELEHWLRTNLRKNPNKEASMTQVKNVYDKFNVSQQGFMGRRSIKKQSLTEFMGSVALQFNLSKVKSFVKKGEDYILKGYDFKN